MNIQVIGLGLALIAGLADVVGGYLIVRQRQVPRMTLLSFIGLGGGFMLAAAVLGRLPEAMAESPNAAVYVVLGYLAIFVCESLFSTHAHQEIVDDHAHALVGTDLYRQEEFPISHPASLAALAGLLIHTFFDGVAIAAGFQLRESVGLLMFLAVFLHKIPEGFSLSTIMLAAQRERLFAFLAAVSLAVTTVLGAAVTFVVGALAPATTHYALALATGTLIYIAASDLIPATGLARTRWTIVYVVLGVGLYYVSLQLLHMVGLE